MLVIEIDNEIFRVLLDNERVVKAPPTRQNLIGMSRDQILTWAINNGGSVKSI